MLRDGRGTFVEFGSQKTEAFVRLQIGQSTAAKRGSRGLILYSVHISRDVREDIVIRWEHVSTILKEI